MNEYEKEYIEFRLILIGNEKVGKKSFINRLLKIPSTSTLRNMDIENAYKNQILKLRNKYEKKKKFLEKLQEINEEITKNDKNKLSDDKTKTTISNANAKSISKSKEKNKKINEIENYIMRITSEELFLTKDYVRPPIPEHPTKLFNIHKSKICVKPFYILPAEKISYDYTSNEEDSDNELDNDLKVSFKGLKNDIKKILNNKKTIIEEEQLNGYKISIYNIFLFIYDMNDFNTFEMLIHYYDLIEGTFNISELYNSIPCVIGNKKDQKFFLSPENENSLNDFIKENNLLFFEISTKPYFNFDKFILDFLLQFLNKYHENLINEYNFKIDFEKIISNKPTFSKFIRDVNPQKNTNPGPKYDVNIYNFDSTNDLNESLNNNKYRFNKKIFYNKIGPKFVVSKSVKDINGSNNDIFKNKNGSFLSETKGGLLDKPIKGYTFGILKGKLNLLKERKELNLKRNESLKESIISESSLLANNMNNITNLKSSRVRGEEYIEEATKRRNKLFEKKKFERKKILNKLSEIHSNNLNSIKEKEEKKKKIIILSHNNNSLSSPDLFSTNNSFNPYTTEEIQNNKSKFLDILYPKNKKYLEEYKQKLKKINDNKKQYQTPAPNSYDIRNNYTDSNKGPTLGGKRKEILLSRLDPSFPNLKDEFDIIVEKSHNNIIKGFTPRFKEIKKEEKTNPYIDEEIWKKWEENKLTNEKKGRIKIFMKYLKQKKKQQLLKMKEIKEQKEEIQKLRREILIRKGYEDENGAKSINYSLVEESSPKYSLKGKHSSFFSINDKNDISNIFPGNTEMLELIKNSQLNRPLPNVNIVKPKLPSIIFNKAERFSKEKEYEGSLDLFKDGVFGLKTQENFSNKQLYTHNTKRDAIYKKTQKSPSPSDYKIKSSFEIIAEKGKKISEIRDKIRIKENLNKNKINNGEEELKLDLSGNNKNENNNKLELKIDNDNDNDNDNINDNN